MVMIFRRYFSISLWKERSKQLESEERSFKTDGIAFTARDRGSLKEALLEPAKEAKRRGLEIN